jgi:hypothetical protein
MESVAFNTILESEQKPDKADIINAAVRQQG